MPRRRNRRMPVYTPQQGVELTTAGDAFLKEAFAPPDFAGTDFHGIPDAFNGKSIMNSYELAFPTGVSDPAENNSSLYILVLPVPGVAYYWIVATDADFASGNVAWNMVPYPDATSSYPYPNQSYTFSTYRVATQAFELINNDPPLTVAGGLSVMKFRANLDRNRSGDYLATGFSALPAVQKKAAFSCHWKDGVYIPLYNTQADWEFAPVIADLPPVGPSGEGKITTDFGTMVLPFGGVNSCPFPGIGTLESAIIRINGWKVGGITTTSFTARAWQCVENTVAQVSPLYRFAGMSPPEDEVALQLYRALITDAPVAVIAAENANFWQTLLGIAQLVGPFGLVGTAAKYIYRAVKGQTTKKETTEVVNRIFDAGRYVKQFYSRQ